MKKIITLLLCIFAISIYANDLSVNSDIEFSLRYMPSSTKNECNVVGYYGKAAETVVIPSYSQKGGPAVTGISAEAFRNNTNIVTLVIKDNV